MNNELYDMIFKRKSFHLFRNIGNEKISPEELQDIERKFDTLVPLVDEIKVRMKIVKKPAFCFKGEEYCLLLYSEKKNNYLQNIGYLGEQLDLYLVSKNIGSLWFGIAKSKEVYNGLNYVIMIAIAKVGEFRKDMFKSKRREVKDIWSGNDLGIANIVRFSPSACNSQPWYVLNKDNMLSVYRKSKSGKIGIMPKNASVHYNQIDIGIFMCVLELCLLEKGITFERTLYRDNQSFDEMVLNAEYLYKAGE